LTRKFCNNFILNLLLPSQSLWNYPAASSLSKLIPSCTFRLLLFKNLKQHARRRNFDIQNQLDNDMEHFFLSQPHRFYAAAIQRPPECRRLVTDSDGDYSLD
uniref:Uncharacterized protein n=1 Tax=Ascaris lumbricoides TaxID=6252 RepID=A0A0M3I604_ASCLU